VESDSLYTAWFDLAWFDKQLLVEEYEYAHSWALHLLWIVPAIFLLRILFVNLFSKKLNVALLQKHVKWSPASLLTLIPNVCLFLFLGLLIFALSRPQKSNEKVELSSEGIDIMLVIDISGSMEMFKDLKPNRLEKTKEVAKEFIDGRFQDRIGLTIFSDKAVLRTKLTTDYTVLKNRIDDLKKHDFGDGGTAIGLGLGRGVEAMSNSKSKSKVLILLSDGDNNTGGAKPELMAELAYADNIKIYTIGIGKRGMAEVDMQYRMPNGQIITRTEQAETNLDEATLKKIAEIGKGKYFRATDNEALTEIFHTIDQMEKVEIKEQRYRSTKDYYQIYLIWSVAFFALWLLTKSTFLTNAIED
jgi:Ca-activated chloride channel family protein